MEQQIIETCTENVGCILSAIVYLAIVCIICNIPIVVLWYKDKNLRKYKKCKILSYVGLFLFPVFEIIIGSLISMSYLVSIYLISTGIVG